jgi:hypothetical protein
MMEDKFLMCHFSWCFHHTYSHRSSTQKCFFIVFSCGMNYWCNDTMSKQTRNRCSDLNLKNSSNVGVLLIVFSLKTCFWHITDFWCIFFLVRNRTWCTCAVLVSLIFQGGGKGEHEQHYKQSYFTTCYIWNKHTTILKLIPHDSADLFCHLAEELYNNYRDVCLQPEQKFLIAPHTKICKM